MGALVPKSIATDKQKQEDNMILVRLIIFIALMSLVWIIYRKISALKNTPSPKAATTSMKKCSHCGVHLPEQDAIKHDQHYFCSLEHQKVFLDQHPDD